LAFGQFGEMGPGLEALLASVAKRGAGEMADRYLIENRARGGSRSAGVPLAAALGSRNLEGANTGPSRDVRRTERRRPAAGRTLVGLVLEAPTQTAGVPGTVGTWVAPTGTPAARALGVAVAPAVGAWTPCAHGAREGQVRGFLGGAPPQKNDYLASEKKK
jgi:hypothetical protein